VSVVPAPATRLKRALDVVLAAVGLVLVAPALLAAGLLVYLEDGAPVVYRQVRVGRGGRPFQVLKLRSMRVNTLDASRPGEVDESHPLVTYTGRVLRRFKIDELLQLINVLRGEMSLVGPRPTVPELAAAYNAFQRRRLEVLPGMTGWAQVNGNVQLSWDERIELDVWYVQHWTPALDAWIVLKTMLVVLAGERRNPSALEAARLDAGVR
jgi:undecaprenyl phosphate N,N'-diacetylbacillosamine 1-phosphate transferase